MTITDQDELQEYQCLLLEGYDEKTARKLARSANNAVNSRRLSGPTTGDTRGGHGQRPLVSDMWEYQDHGVSITQDTRSDMERETDWERADFSRKCLDMMAPRQRAVVSDCFGFETGTPMSGRETAAKNGIPTQKVWRYRADGVRRVRKQLDRLGVTKVTEESTDRS